MDRRELLTLAAAGPWPAREKPLRVALPSSWGPPFVLAQPHQAPRGILPELVLLIAQELQAPVEWVRLPALRAVAAMENGEVDLHCPMHPDWWGEVVPPQRWSAPVLTLREVLVAGRDGPAQWPPLGAGAPLTVGTVRGYLYPTLDGDFRTGRLRRQNAATQEAVLHMLARQRLPVGIVNELALIAFNRSLPAAERLRQLHVVKTVEARCLLARAPHHDAAELLQVIDRLSRAGRFKTLLMPHQTP